MMKSASQIFFAFLLLGVGVILLLINLGVISLEIREFLDYIYPFLLLLLGSIWFIQSFMRRSSARLFFGILFIVLSILLILDRSGALTFHFSDIWNLWPIIFIYIGIKKLFFKKRKVHVKDYSKYSKNWSYSFDSNDFKMKNEDENPNHMSFEETKWDKKADYDKNVFVGNIEFKQSNWYLEPMNLISAIGNYYIDFSKAFIPDQETPVYIKGRVGDVKIILPEDVPVKIEAYNSIGDIKLFSKSQDNIGRGTLVTFTSPDYEEATKKIYLKIKLNIGSIRIDRV